MASSPIKTNSTPHPLEMNSSDALYSLEAAEACIDAIQMEYTVEGSMSIHILALAVSNIHVAMAYLQSLSAKSEIDEIPF